CPRPLAGRQPRGMEVSADQSLLDAEGRNFNSKEVSGQFNYIRAGITACGVCLKLAVAVAVIVYFAPGATSLTGQTNQGTVIPPLRQGLLPVQLPDMRSMEPDVREHVTWAQDVLVAAVKDPATPADKLGAVYGVTGQIYQAYSLNSAAKECYLNASRLAPKDFRWVYLLGKLYEREGDARQTIDYYDAARLLRPDYLPVFVSLGNVYLQLNRLDEAEANFRRALESNENIAAAHYGLGQAALSKRSYADAARHLEKAVSLAPEANRLQYALAMAYRGLGKMDQAQSHLALSGTVGVRASDPLLDGLQDLIKGARLHLIRGRTALEARRFSEAADQFRKAVAAQPDSIPAHFNLAAALTQTGDLRGAVEQFEETLRLDPKHANAHYNLGLLLAQANRHDEAIKHLRSAVNAEPTDIHARSLLGQELLKVRRLEEAETELSRIVQSDPNNEDALLGWVTTLLLKKQYGQALEALEKGHEQFPQKGRTSVTLAYLLAASPQYERRDGKRALKLAQAVYETTGSVNHGVLVAMALAELGRCDEAAAWMKRLTNKAAGEGKPDLIEKLKAELSRYERARPCRPTSDLFSDESLSR
ncbi:MAG: tetratricopeptide repeat protein, partial [Acidobacteriota bacterium]|nr:tetratricopeptide repeat protein [Acidobacteriota bacterium]